ncbi:LysR family transcriptional regulator [Acanthopleuribacter pedis]|uniref:LysR family transcriptional regulator n=1 Tax=Acanthopleuribacter pedis TaxID=442870 RepID=A0A8J7U0S7_9BACT|nr:LysR family transcriptional regulator [Acanthopleuribacter pedis]MBO1316832.1 LysR family transcriptional regulator [Acanthopleuribacter pedis]
MDLLEPMVVFAKVAEEGSMTAAARALGVSKSLVSKKIGTLETRLQTRLLQRTTRALQLTADGARFLEHCRRLTGIAEQAVEELAEQQGMVAGLLRITAPVTFGQAYMDPLVRAFCDQYPGITAQLILENQKMNLVRDDIDIAIRISHDLPADHIALPLTSMHEWVVASPGYLAKHGTPTTPMDLADHHCLLNCNPDPVNRWWFTKDSGVIEVTVPSRLSTNYHFMMMQALLDDAGIARMPSYAVEEHLSAGRLVRLLADYKLPTFPVVLLYAPGNVVPSRVRRFARFTKSWFQNQPRSFC